MKSSIQNGHVGPVGLGHAATVPSRRRHAALGALLVSLVTFGGQACSDPSGTAASADADSVTGDVVEKDVVVRPDVPKPFPDVVLVTECGGDDACDDGLFCNGPETCRPTAIGAAPNGCLAGELPRPEDDDLSDCVVSSACDEETDSFPPRTLAQGEACDDGIACTVSDVCVDGKRCEGTLDDGRCDDGAFCNGVETCTRTIGCVAGTPPTAPDADPGDCLVPGPCDETTDSHPLIPAPLGQPCNDSVACTKGDGCTSAGTCGGTPNDDACSDGIFCNGAELCSATDGCGPGVAAPPADDTPDDCFEPGPCDEAAQGYPLVPRAAGAACSDGVACTVGDACAGEACVGTPDATLCADGLFCNGVEHCGVTGCEPGPEPGPVDSDLTDCLAPTGPCSEALDAFEQEPAPPGAPCDDAVDCTTDDTCDASAACVGAPDHALCDDQLYCNGLELCTATGCVAGEVPTPIDAEPLDCLLPNATCDEALDGFGEHPAAADAPCNDDVACTVGDLCDGSGTCGGTLTSALCDDGQFCNGAEQCTAAGCTSGTAPVPPTDTDPNDCYLPNTTCDETSDGFPPVQRPASAPCDDGNLCTIEDACTAAGTCGGTPSGAMCVSGVCAGGVCQAPTCTDDAQNGTERGVDCGGPCAGCPNGTACGAASDCDSGYCASVCGDDPCKNGSLDVGETGIDCGGPCTGCGTGLACKTTGDCLAGLTCTDLVCGL